MTNTPKLHQLAANFSRVDLPGISIYYSYETPIAFYGSEGLVIRQNDWSTTTGKHLNAVNERKSIRITGAEFSAKLEAEFAGVGV